MNLKDRVSLKTVMADNRKVIAKEKSQLSPSNNSRGEDSSDADDDDLIHNTPVKLRKVSSDDDNCSSLASSPRSRHSSPELLSKSPQKVAVCRPCVVADSSPITHRDTLNVESTLRRLVDAALQLAAYERNDMVMKFENIDPSIDQQSFMNIVMTSFHRVLPPAYSYVNQLPGFPAMPMSDRRMLFATSLVPFIVAQLSLPANKEFRFFGFNQHNRELFIKSFPSYQTFNVLLDDIGDVFCKWNPTTAELSLLFGMIFFQDSMTERLSNSQLVLDVSNRLKNVLNATLKQSSGYERRLRYFMQAYDLLRCSSQSYIDAATAIFDGNRDLTADQLYLDFFVQDGSGWAGAGDRPRSILFSHAPPQPTPCRLTDCNQEDQVKQITS